MESWTEEPPRPELPEGYYVDNFAVLLRTVTERYDDLLSESEAAYASTFLALDTAAQRLYVRLVSRKGPCFRRDLLSYPEIDDLGKAAASLIRVGFLDRAEKAPTAELLAVLRRHELAKLVGALARVDPSAELSAVKGRKRGELEDHLLNLARDPTSAIDPATEIRRRYEIWRPLHHEVLVLYRLLFFGNLWQSLSEFVIADLGIVRYETYSISKRYRWFVERADIDQGLAVRVLRETVSDLIEAEQLDAALALVRSALDEAWRPEARSRLDGVACSVARHLERRERRHEALELYEFCELPPARERRCRVLDRLERFDEALALCHELQVAPKDETERAFAPAFAHRLKRKSGLTRAPWKRPRRPTASLEIEPLDRESDSVESATLKALVADGRSGIYSENWFWRSLFGLAFWDIVFAPVPGAFHHPFQVAPADLSTAGFRAARRESITERLQELRECVDLAARLWPVYEAKFGLANALMPWAPGLETPLRWGLDRVAGTAAATILDRLSADWRRYRRGLPDLLIEAPDAPHGFELWEIKGPGDSLRPEQGAWIDFLNRSGISAKVVKVRW